MSGTKHITNLENALGHQFRRNELLRQALTHSSASSVDGQPSLERLEFLGDRVLALAIASALLRRFPDEEEGALARRLSSLVSGESLVRIANELEISHHIRVELGVTKDRIPNSILEDACEALIGAVYLDGGFTVAADLIERLWTPLITVDPPSDAKTELQEWVQARGTKLPIYKTVAAEGPPHAPVFTVEAVIDGFEPVQSSASSKRGAERAAAVVLLARAKESHG